MFKILRPGFEPSEQEVASLLPKSEDEDYKLLREEIYPYLPKSLKKAFNLRAKNVEYQKQLVGAYLGGLSELEKENLGSEVRELIRHMKHRYNLRPRTKKGGKRRGLAFAPRRTLRKTSKFRK
jgi:hypothetical protein